MYVGPWQEYAIARTRKANEMKSKLSSRFKEDLENAMINSLDPVSAARAMKAMEKVMDRSEVPFAIDGEIVGGGQKKRRPPKVVAGQHNLTAYKLQLPSVSPGSVHSQGDVGGHLTTPDSVRTSASEPLDAHKRSSNLISPRMKARKNREALVGDVFDDTASTNSAYSHMSVMSRGGMNDSAESGERPYQSLADHLGRIPSVPSNLPKVETGLGAVSPEIRSRRHHHLEKKWGPQPPYNSSAAVTALRLAKVGARQQKPMLTYAGYWDSMKESKGGGRLGIEKELMTDRIGSSEEVETGVGARAGRVQSRREEDIINKVERVKRMQQIYSGKYASTDSQRGSGEVGGRALYSVNPAAAAAAAAAADGGSAIVGSILDENVASSTAPPTPLLTQYQHFDATKPQGFTDSPLGTSLKKSYAYDGRGSDGVLKKPTTPVVTEMDLTDHELAVISKYFPDQLEQPSASFSSPPSAGAVAAIAAAGTEKIEVTTPVGARSQMMDASEQDDEEVVQVSASSASAADWKGHVEYPPLSTAVTATNHAGSNAQGIKITPVEGLASLSGESPNPSPVVQLSPVGIGVQITQRELSSGRQRVFSDLVSINSPDTLVVGAGVGAGAGGAMDDLYAGGAGGHDLLDWSRKLDVDLL